MSFSIKVLRFWAYTARAQGVEALDRESCTAYHGTIIAEIVGVRLRQLETKT